MTRTLIVALLAATALSGATASAQPNNDRGRDHSDAAASKGKDLGVGKGLENGRGPDGNGPPGQVRHEAQAQAQARSQVQVQVRPQGQARLSPQEGYRRSQQGIVGGAVTGGAYYGGRTSGFAYQGRSYNQIQLGGFSYPSGYGYRRWGDGALRRLLFLGAIYGFDNYSTYGFGAPPPGYRWVRYGPDLLLVSRSSGRIRDVVYGVFY